MEDEPNNDSTVQEDKLTEALKEENAVLKEQLLDAQFKQHLAECRLAAAKQTIAALQGQLKEARSVLVNKMAELDQKMNVTKQKLGQVNASNSAASVNHQGKYWWIRTHKGQAQQTDNQVEKHWEKDLEAAKYQEETEGLHRKIQQLKNQLSNEEALWKISKSAALEMQNELHNKNEEGECRHHRCPEDHRGAAGQPPDPVAAGEENSAASPGDPEGEAGGLVSEGERHDVQDEQPGELHEGDVRTKDQEGRPGTSCTVAPDELVGG